MLRVASGSHASFDRSGKFTLEDQRRYFTGRLQNVGAPPAEEEQAFIAKWSRMLPEARWGVWMLSWLRALAAYGTPATFLDKLEFRTHTFRESGMNWPSQSREGGNYEQRRLLTAAQRPYVSRVPVSARPHRLDPACVLCQNVMQALDSCAFPQRVPNNAMLNFSDAMILPNRYPGFPLHMLWMPKDHDDMSQRVPETLLRDGEKTWKEWRPEPGKTRGRLVEAAELKKIFSRSLAIGLVALRNHTLSGMSLGAHDHWHLIPLECYPPNWFPNIAAVPSNTAPGVTTLRANGTPYDVLVLRHPDIETLAAETALLMNALERDNQVFSPAFVPIGAGMVLLAPVRREAVAHRYVQVGGSVEVHERDPANQAEAERYELYVPRRYEFPWNRFGVEGVMAERRFTREEILRRHKPIDYAQMSEWGDGRYVLRELTLLGQRVYEVLRSLQDKRDDKGHADIVTHFTLRLAGIMGLSPDEKEAVALAAIAHDSGWGSVPEINVIWNQLATQYKFGNPGERRHAEEEMYRLREGHERKAAEQLGSLIPEHPYLEQILRVVGNHDRRIEVPPPIFRAFLDGDWLWRVTLPSQLALSSGNYDRGDPETVLKALEEEFTPQDFLLPWAYHIARMELAATMLAMAPRFSWKAQPERFGREYADELAALRG